MPTLLPILFAALTTLAPGFSPQARMYVSAVAGVQQEQATVAAPDGATVTVVEVASESLLAHHAQLVACPLAAPGVADCTAPKPLTRGPAGTWTATSRSPFGVAFVPAPGTTATFRLALNTAQTRVVPVPAAAPTLADAGPRTDSVGLALDPPAQLPQRGEGPIALGVTPIVAAPVAVATGLHPAAARSRVPTGGNAATPPAGIVLALVGVVALIGTRAFPGSNRQAKRSPRVPVSPGSSVRVVGWLAALGLPMLLGEASVYKLGLVMIVLVGAIGLHLLVNWAGELSLAHAALVGLPAFVVAKLSADHGISPVVLLPLAIAVGVAAGAFVGLPALRARGLQVALVTLATGVAIDRFFFTKGWLTGDVSGAHVASPTLGPIDLRTARSLYPLLAVCLVLAVAGAWLIYNSKIGRGFLWVKANPDAAAAFGIPTASYRVLAYVLAGAYAGFAGGLTAMWVQRLTPAEFPLTLSFTYLIIAALAGRGFVGGVAAAAGAVEGGRLFLASGAAFITYAAPIGLILTLTQQQAGLNGLGRQCKERIVKLQLRPLIAAGVVSLALGFAAIGLAWYHAGNTSQVWIQNQELVSGGIGGLALVVLGVGLVLTDRLTELSKRLAPSD